jgi:hypothetical protein
VQFGEPGDHDAPIPYGCFLSLSAVRAFAGSTLLEDEPSGKGAEEMRDLWNFVKSRIDEKTISGKKAKELLHV